MCENRGKTSLNSPNSGNTSQGCAMSSNCDAFATTQLGLCKEIKKKTGVTP